MKITMLNEIIKSADLFRGENHLEFRLRLANTSNLLIFENPDMELIERFLIIVNKSALSRVRNVPVRFIIHEDEYDEETTKIFAIGGFFDDSWLVTFQYGGAEIMTFEKVLEYHEMSEAELQILI